MELCPLTDSTASNGDLYQDETSKDKESFESEFELILMKFLIKLHADSSLSKQFIDDLCCMIQNDIVKPILNYVVDDSFKEKIRLSFDKLNTFYKFKKKLKEDGKLTDAKQITVSKKTDLVLKDGNPTYMTVTDTVTLMPINEQIKLFFELPNVLETTVDYMKKLENDDNSMTNFIQGELWQGVKKKYKNEDIVIPCFLYHDDFVADNPLSSNALSSKIAAFYYSFPVIPQHLLSSPSYIFDAMFFQSSLKNTIELDLLLNPIIDVFKELEEEGLILNINGEERRIFVVLSLIVGDNLALNELIGLTKSFNASNFCRFCTTSKENTNHDTSIRQANVRTVSAYEDHVNKKMFGWKFVCPFIKLNNFHPITNYSCDLMHDIFEGVARYDIALILKYIIYDHKIINLRTMNKLKQEFDYGSIDIGNLGPELQENQIKNGQVTMSASEMKTFIHYLPMILGHKLTDRKHLSTWNLLLKLVEIIDLVLKSSFSEEDMLKVKVLIPSYLEHRQKTFPKHTLKPKHHILLHYYDCINNSGPLKNMMTFSYEQRNRIVKKYSKVSHQRVNLAFSISYKCLMKFNYFLYQLKNGFPNVYSYDKKIRLDINELKSKNYFAFITFEESWENENYEIFSLEIIRYKSSLFKIGFSIVIGSNEIECFRIVDILEYNQKYFLILQKIEIVEYSKHMMCYITGNVLEEYKMYELNDINFFPFNIHETYEGKKAFRLKTI